MLFRFAVMPVGFWLFLWSILTQASQAYPVEVRRVLLSQALLRFMEALP